jgi:hypothetical protein
LITPIRRPKTKDPRPKGTEPRNCGTENQYVNKGTKEQKSNQRGMCHWLLMNHGASFFQKPINRC